MRLRCRWPRVCLCVTQTEIPKGLSWQCVWVLVGHLLPKEGVGLRTTAAGSESVGNLIQLLRLVHLYRNIVGILLRRTRLVARSGSVRRVCGLVARVLDGWRLGVGSRRRRIVILVVGIDLPGVTSSKFSCRRYSGVDRRRRTGGRTGHGLSGERHASDVPRRGGHRSTAGLSSRDESIEHRLGCLSLYDGSGNRRKIEEGAG